MRHRRKKRPQMSAEPTAPNEDPVAGLLLCIIRGIVDQPDRVELRSFDHGSETSYEVAVAQEDLGKVIGRQGRVANALRQAARAAAMPTRRRVQVEIVS